MKSRPRASISSKDEIRFNKKAVEDLGLKKIEHVTLWWDEDEEIIALKPCDAKAKHAVPLRPVVKDGAVRIPSKAFFRFFKIEGAFTGLKCVPEWDKSKELIVIKLGKS